MGAIEDMRQIVFRVTDERDAARDEVERLKEKLETELFNSVTLQTQRDEARAEMHVYKIRADGHYEDYCEMLRRIDVVVNERDQARAEVERLKIEVQNGNVRHETALVELRHTSDQRDDARKQRDEILADRDNVRQERDEARAEVERLTKERNEAREEMRRLRNGWNESYDELQRQKGPCHDLRVVAETRMKERDEARAEAKRFSKIADLMHIERDQAREELQLLKQERDLWQQIQRDEATVNQSLTVRPEPSRLEIAAMVAPAICHLGCGMDPEVNDFLAACVQVADALIAAAKEEK